MRKLKILVKGSIGNRNLGDDLLVFAITDQLMKTGVPMNVHYQTKNNYFPYIPDQNVYQPFRYKRFDAVIFAGGTQFATFNPSKKSLLQQLSNLFHNPRKFAKDTAGAIKKRLEHFNVKYKRLVLTGIGLGPFHSKDQYYLQTIDLLKRADLVIVRDELSASICRKEKIAFTHGSDLVYSVKPLIIPQQDEGSIKSDESRGGGTGVKKIAIIVRDWQFSEERASYIDSLLEINTGFSISYFSFCREKDSLCLQKLESGGNGSDLFIWDPERHNITEFVGNLAGYDLIITARYHGAILAALAGRPFISIGIEPKLEMIAALYGMPVWNYPYEIEQLVDAVNTVDVNYIDYVSRINQQVLVEMKKSEEMRDTLTSFLKSSQW